MKAIILVGGEGTRLRPLTCNIVKAMVPLLNCPFLEHVLLWLKAYGVDEVVLTLGYLPERIAYYFGDGSKFGLKLHYVHEATPLGTAGAVKNAEHLLKGSRFFVLNGDIFTDLDLSAMLAFHKQKGGKGTLSLTPVDNPTIYGLVETNAQQRIQRFLEKPTWDQVTTNLINAGVYILEPEALDFIPPSERYMFEKGLFPKLLDMGWPLYGYPFDSYWMDMGTPEKYLQLHYDLLRGLSKRGPALKDGLILGEGSRLDPAAQLQGPIIIGRSCTIEAQAHLIGPTVIGDNCHIGSRAMVEGSVLWQKVSIGEGAVVSRAIIAGGSRIGSKAVISEDAVLSDNVTVAPGFTVEPHSRLLPNTHLEAKG